jgi:uncharacterized protein (TIGR02246 family)
MLRNILFVGALASAHAFLATPTVSLRGSSPAMAPSRHLRATNLQMIDADTVVAALPGLAALGVALTNQIPGMFSNPPPTHAIHHHTSNKLQVASNGHADERCALAGTTATGQAVAGVAAPAAPAAPATMPTIELARQNFNKWNSALQTKNPKTVADIYHSQELSFLPTVSPQHIKDYGSTEEYFTAFVQKNPYGTITDDSIQVYGNGEAYLHSGMYTFELGDAGARTPVKARFSYVWKNVNGQWKITHHHSSVRPAGPDMLQLARDNFKRWNDSLQTKDPKKVAALYSNDGLSFLPTVSPQHIKGTDSTEEYFIAFVQKNPFGTITDDSVTVFDDGESYLHSGMYTFELGDAGARTPVEARFSYVWRKEGGDWKITHHHSSVRPAA